MMLLGTITGGLAYTRAIGLTNAVREGARFGATGDIASVDLVDRRDRPRARDPVRRRDDRPRTSTTTVCVQVIGATPVAATCSTAGVNPPPAPVFPVADADLPALGAGECLVKVWASRHFEITLGVAEAKEGDMLRYSVARYERDC